MKLFLPGFYARVHMDLRLQLRSYNMGPDRKRTAQVSRQIHPSVLSDSHSPLIHLALDFQIGRLMFGNSTSHFVQVRDFSCVSTRAQVPAMCK